jgi:hypothetical protein
MSFCCSFFLRLIIQQLTLFSQLVRIWNFYPFKFLPFNPSVFFLSFFLIFRQIDRFSMLLIQGPFYFLIIRVFFALTVILFWAIPVIFKALTFQLRFFFVIQVTWRLQIFQGFTLLHSRFVWLLSYPFLNLFTWILSIPWLLVRGIRDS